MRPVVPLDAEPRVRGIESPTERANYLRREADLHDRVAERFRVLGEIERAEQQRLLAEQYRAAAEQCT
jgi:hypothetical protein